jgi:hypothetical protein
MGSFLDNMAFLTGSQRTVLKQTGADTPVALESAVETNPEAYGRLLGQPTLRKLMLALDQLVTPDERRKLKETPAANCLFGMAVDEPSPEVSQTALHEERDRLHSELRRLRASNDQSEKTTEHMKSVREQLSVVLELLKNRAA